MTDFQVGDRVSVEGIVTQLWPDAKPGSLVLIQVKGEEETEMWFLTKSLTLVERPRRKLRVGSVWERTSPTIGKEYDRYVWTGLTFVSPHGDRYDRETRDFDTHPELWHEVPVEELENEAADGS